MPAGPARAGREWRLFVGGASASAGEALLCTFEGCNEGDEMNGSGSAKLLEDGTPKVEMACHLGDDACFRAERNRCSRSC